METIGKNNLLVDDEKHKAAETGSHIFKDRRNSEDKLKMLFEMLPVGVSAIDAENRIVYVNPALEKILCITREGLLRGDYHRRLYLRGDGTSIEPKEFASRRALDEGHAIYDFETGVVLENDRVIWTNVSAVPVNIADWRVILVTSDITDRKRMEEKAAQLAAIVESSDDIVISKSLDGVITSWNKGAERIYGYTEDEVIGKPISILAPPERENEMVEILERIGAGMRVDRFDTVRCGKDGSLIPVALNISPIRNAAGRLIGASTIGSDSTQRIRTENALRESEERYRSLVENANDIIYTIDLDGNFTSVNPAAERIMGYTRDEVLTLNLAQLLSAQDYARARLILKEKIDKGVSKAYQLEIRAKDGRMVPLELSTHLICKDGVPVGSQGVARDISERKEAERRVLSLLAEKDLLLSEIRHRIKNSITTIGSLLGLQAEALNDPAAVSALTDAKNRVDSIGLLYDRLYQATGGKEISIREYLDSLVDEIVSNFPNCESVKIEKRIDDFMLDAAKAQPLGLIVNELLTNIMKYAFKGRFDAKISLDAKNIGSLAVVSIQDNGIGMPDSVDFGNSTGLGLCLVDMLVKQLRGQIRIERGGGTKIVLEFEIGKR